ncbi:hypothetical protein C8F04DRAFT_126711 [Mycena alexandri]|uniref:Uncharacterized protein n=1 Tax=Mycena alexandri TaxID=1745969 RepID=A0AAD6SD85_9AGAR|nr:hypothetical protein C8F04DRAFT_126711 [Mycena alexandri]
MDPRLPPELERQIFETTALAHRVMIPTLLRVARRTHVWIEPLLYRILGPDVRRGRDMFRVIRVFLNTKPPRFFSDAVRHLHLPPASHLTQGQARRLASLSIHLVDFAAGGFSSEPGLLPILARLHIRHLSISLGQMFSVTGASRGIDFHHQVFNSVTHLTVYDRPDDFIYIGIPTLPALTHLSMKKTVLWGALHTLLTKCTRLQVFINVWPPSEIRSVRGLMVPSPDPRFVMVAFDDYWADWKAGAEGQLDLWAMAEDFIAQKRRGDIPEGQSFMDHRM